MLCGDNVFYLEIVDIIRGFGLIVLKGVMEARANKFWARFVVEPEVKHSSFESSHRTKKQN